jgi:rhodanese-related sulfurtransferase
MSEIPADRNVLVYCYSGQRSYVACRILCKHGYRCRNLSGSYATWSAAQRARNASGATVPQTELSKPIAAL